MTKLPFHEWLIICLLIGILTLLTVLTLFRTHDAPPIASFTHELNSEVINVTVKGAVRKEGAYELKKGALLQDVLKLAQPLPEANLSHLKLESRLRNNQMIKVPKDSWITVYIEGAVAKPGALQVKLGTLVKDLPHLLTFSSDADIEKLNRKRRLKDQEVVQVTVKKSQVQLKTKSIRKKIKEENPVNSELNPCKN